MEPQEITFASNPENKLYIEKFVNSIFDELNISKDYYGIILTSLSEAVDNAIKHGNKNNPEKYVHIIFESKPDGLAFSIKDEGDGFDFNKIPDPTEVQKDGTYFEGKGIFKIKSLADSVTFSDHGRMIETIFNVPGVNHQLASERVKSLKSFFKEKYKLVYKADAQGE
jgi:serine/threonine-protein kinase RsbW